MTTLLFVLVLVFGVMPLWTQPIDPTSSSPLINSQPISNQTATYETALRLEKDLLTNYSDTIRPIINQTSSMAVFLDFRVNGILEIDEVKETVLINMDIAVQWQDDLLTWNPEDYGGLKLMHPTANKRWRPRLMILNSVDKRDVFSDELHPYIVQWDGTVFWTPTSVFRTYCTLDMTKFPFDVQRCIILVQPVEFIFDELQLFVIDPVKLDQVKEHGEWIVAGAYGTRFPKAIHPRTMSRVSVTLILARRPAFIVLNVCLPIAVLSLLNVAVFRVPIDSGEKLSYTLTVLLALAVFMSIVSGMLPTTSATIPLLTIYLSSLLGLSTCSALLTVYIMGVAHRPEFQPVPKSLKLLVACMNGRKPRDRIQPLNGDAKINWKSVSEALDKLFLYLTTSLVLVTSLGVAIIITN